MKLIPKGKKIVAGKVVGQVGGKLQDRNLAAVNPLKEQFEPRGSEPVRQHANMAGQP